jgi:hypothetical protein
MSQRRPRQVGPTRQREKGEGRKKQAGRADEAGPKRRSWATRGGREKVTRGQLGHAGGAEKAG